MELFNVTFNVLRVSGDLVHVSSFFILLLKIYGTKNVKGLSLKTQALYLFLFCCRYSDIFWNYRPMWNFVLKVVFILATALTCYVIRFKKPYSDHYSAELDSFNVWYLIVPCAMLALVWNDEFTTFEVVWAFSIYLEAFAIFPQLYVVQKIAAMEGTVTGVEGSVENLTAKYMFSLGLYRGLYLLNWMYRYNYEFEYWDPISWFGGVIQIALYADFLYYYIKAARKGSEKVYLPV